MRTSPASCSRRATPASERQGLCQRPSRPSFKKSDNQAKLARAECDEKHLYVRFDDQGSGAVLEELAASDCPADPAGVIDVLWAWSPSISSHLFNVQPGTDAWERFNSVTGEPL